MDHETCSGSLGPYVRDELRPDTRAEVDEHLAGCADCRAEEAGLRALVSLGIEQLGDMDRARLERSVREQIVVPAMPKEKRKPWVATALGTAAILVVLVMGVQFMSGLSGEDESADTGGAARESGAGGELAGPTPRTLTLSGDRLIGSTGEVAIGEGSAPAESAPLDEEPQQTKDQERSDTSTSDASGGVDPDRFQENSGDGLPKLSDGYTLRRAADTRDLLGGFARAYSASDIDALRGPFVEQLLADAPSKTARDQILECDLLVGGAREVPMLPVLAAHGRHEGRPSLLLGYLSPDEPSDELTVSTFFVWPRGDCSIPSSTQFGRIRN